LWYGLSPSQRRRVPFRALAWGEGTNSAQLFTAGEREALAKSKVHQWSRPLVTNRGWSSSLISKIWLFASSGINKISIFKSIYLENHVSHNELWNASQFLFEEMRRIDLLWKIVEYRESLLRMFNVYEFCCFNLLRRTCTAFLFNEAVLKSAKSPCLI
jgi:hypothetical protein